MLGAGGRQGRNDSVVGVWILAGVRVGESLGEGWPRGLFVVLLEEVRE